MFHDIKCRVRYAVRLLVPTIYIQTKLSRINFWKLYNFTSVQHYNKMTFPKSIRKYLIAISITKCNTDLISSISGWRTAGLDWNRVRTTSYILYIKWSYELVSLLGIIITRITINASEEKQFSLQKLLSLLIYSSVIFIHQLVTLKYRTRNEPFSTSTQTHNLITYQQKK